jgi:enoyl-[acyl-carrier protein] reductase/trans-2-enoyl-CoA reductase (NAD+)
MIRNNICLNAHPAGCARDVEEQVARVGTMKLGSGERAPRHVLVIGCSAGYGLASRIVAAFGYKASTLGISFEREPSATKTGSPGWYTNRAFDRLAAQRGLEAKTYSVDAFSKEAKDLAIREARAGAYAYDLVIYSLASPVRVDPDTGVMYRSVIKPIGKSFSGTNADPFSGKLSPASVEPASDQEIAETIKVMGGQDWELWIDALAEAGVLAPGALSAAYSYIGPPLSHAIYKEGTIGKAKEDLERASRSLNARYKELGLQAFVSINKAVVTRSSAVIPVIPLYVSVLFKVMKEDGSHEDCLDQMGRLFAERLYMGSGRRVPVDSEGRIRLDELEMRDSVQQKVLDLMNRIDQENLTRLADIEGFKSDFLRVHGFGIPGVDYQADVDPLA